MAPNQSLPSFDGIPPFFLADTTQLLKNRRAKAQARARKTHSDKLELKPTMNMPVSMIANGESATKYTNFRSKTEGHHTTYARA
ncbi:uncharacterized protein N7483_009610 [Penicillium malachiteum]|uniref:uncharacterized protein n=1 Tax=Penicillium malachiteum TaxID=1324776 RepID=UPI002549C08D|nr:uncharacterized protein N7483_009610 [Penicillium malachiteum]KAJ5721676.1 hypothetical protein N7483_009610 [Penicillium malachiteum]